MNRDEKIELLRLIDQKEQAKKDHNLENFHGSLIQNEYLCSTAKIAFLGGANQCGKTTVGGVDTDIQVTGIIPTSLKDKYPKDKIKHGDYWVSSLGTKEIGEITYPKIRTYLPTNHIAGWNKQEGILRLKDGAEIRFKSEEQGEDKYQGAVKDGVWLDEEHKKKIWDECYMRTVTKEGWMRMTFTPLKGLTWAYQLFLKANKYYSTENIHGIQEGVGIIHTLDEIKLLKQRKLVIRENTDPEADPDIEFYTMSIYDNKHLTDDAIQKAERKYKDDPIQYHARILGRFSKLTGRNVFNPEKLLRLQNECKAEFKRGEIENKTFQINKRGHLVIFKQPVAGATYVIAGDVAEGLEHGDYSCAQVLRKGTCEQVAIWHGHCSPDEFGRILVDIGTYYNKASLAPERNFHGFGVVNRIRDHYKYCKLYYDYDAPSQTLTGKKRGIKRYGWETNRKTRPIMIQDLAAFINEGQIKINDPQTIEELITFVYDKNGNTGAMGGCYDDRVMALAITIQLYKRVALPTYRDDSIEYEDPQNPITGY